MKVTCGGCSRVWGGLRAAHCAKCHRTFVSPNAFDEHQKRMVKGAILCRDPSSIGLVFDEGKDLYRYMTPDEEKDSHGVRRM